MSKYTTELRYICEVESGLSESGGFNDINTILNAARANIFNFDYPIFDEAYRPVLEKKILKHYYTREICAESVGLWKHYLDSRLNDIMPYYNKLYESEALQFNPLRDVDITKDHTGSGTSNSDYDRTDAETSNRTRTDNLSRSTTDGGSESESGSDINKNTRWDIYSDTPQGALTGVENEEYLTNARKIIDDGTGTNHSNTTLFGKTVQEHDTGTQQLGGTRNLTIGSTEDISTTDEYIEHIVGKTGGVSYSKLLKEYRDTFINIDLRIINELSDLFFGLW